MTKQENREFIITSTIVFALYFGIIQLHLVTNRFIRHTNIIANHEYIYNTINTNQEVSYYSKIIPIDIILLIFLSFALYMMISKIKKTDCFNIYDGYRYIKENGVYIGLILLAILIFDYSLADADRNPRVYLALRTEDIPHILYIIPSLTAPFLMWLGLDMKSNRKVDIIALAVFIIWSLMLVFYTFIIIIFFDENTQHMA